MKKVLTIIFLILSACSKDDVREPSLKTVSIVYSPPYDCMISGRIDDLGTRSISDHGFIYSESQWGIFYSEESSSKISLGIPSKLGPVQAKTTVTSDYWYTKRYYARMYIITEKGIMYGDTVSCRIPMSIY